MRGLKHDPHDVELTVELLLPRSDRALLRPSLLTSRPKPSRSPRKSKRVTLTAGCNRPWSRASGAAVAAAHGIQLSTIVLLAPGALPKTTSGKIQRYACREGVRSGSLPTIARWDVSGAAWPLERTA